MNTLRRQHHLAALLLAGLLAPGAPAVAGRCVATGEEACLLDDRFLVRVLFDEGGARRAARLLALEGEGLDAARFSFSPADQADRVDLDLRMVDGQAVNGFFWLIASGAPTGAEIEVTDVVTARTRRFIKQEGERHLRDREAFGAEAQVVSVTVDTARAVKKSMSVDGGAITVLDAQGTRFQVVFPALALNLNTDITVTPVSAIAGLPLSGGFRGAVRIEPEGLVPARTVLLTVTPATTVARAQQATFAFRGLAGEFFLTSPLVPSTPIVVPIHRLGGFGLGVATDGDLTAQLARSPTREDDRLAQRLAGLLLAARRAGATKVPSTAVPLLQQEYTARIQPKLQATAQNNLAKHYAAVRNWILAVRDNGFARPSFVGNSVAEADSLAVLEARVRQAVIDLARRDLNRYGDLCINLSDRRAMVAAFGAFAELGRESAVRPEDTAKIKKCIRFEFQWATELHGMSAHGIVEDVASAVVPLTYSRGKITGSLLVSQAPTFQARPCSTTLKSLTPVTITVYRVDIPNLNFFDSFEDASAPQRTKLTIYYDVLPGNQVTRWVISCPGSGPINSNTSWVFMYIVAHFDELDPEFHFKAELQPGASLSNLWGSKSYVRTVADVVEDTDLLLFHDPQ